VRTLTEYYRREACKRLGVEAVTADAFIRLAINRLAARDKGVRIRKSGLETIDIDVGDGYYSEATLSEALAAAVLATEEPLADRMEDAADRLELQSAIRTDDAEQILRAGANRIRELESRQSC